MIDDEDGQTKRGLFLTNYFPPPDDVRFDGRGEVEVISKAYPVSLWFTWLRGAGFTVTHIAEPPAVPDGQIPPYTSDDWTNHEGHLHAIPTTVIFIAKKRGVA